MSGDEFDFDDDDLGLDGIGDDPFGGEAGGGSEERSPIVAARSSFVNSATDSLVNPQAATRAIRKSLPTGYKEATDLASEVATGASDLYDKAEKRLEPAIKSTKAATRAILPKAEKVLPKFVTEKLKEFSKEDRGLSSINADEQTMQTSLSQIFETQAQASEVGRQESEAKADFREQATQLRHEESTDRLVGIQDSLSRLVGYQDSVTAQYQRKSLELQFKHYFAARDLLKVQQASNADIVTALNDIKTNTGLPDFVKTQANENWQQQLSERLRGTAVESVGQWADNFRNNLFGNLRDRALNAVGEFGDAVQGGMDGVTSMMEMSAQMEEMGGGMSGTEFAADAAGGIAGNRILNSIAGRLGGWLGSNDRMSNMGLRWGERARTFNTDIMDFMDENEDRGTALNWLREQLRAAAPQRRTDEQVLHNLSSQGSEFVQWDLLSRRTLVEIIPDYLSRINQNTEMMVTGQHADRMVFDKNTEMMTRETNAVSAMAERVVDKVKIERYQDSLDKVVEKIVGSYPLSPAAMAALKEQIHIDTRQGRDYKPQRYFSEDGFADHIDGEPRRELLEFFHEKYKVKDVVDQETLERTTEWDTTNETLLGNRAIGKEIAGLRKDVPQMQEAINSIMANGDKAILRQTGWIQSKNGKDVFNENLWRDVLTGAVTLEDLEKDYAKAAKEYSPVQPTLSTDTLSVSVDPISVQQPDFTQLDAFGGQMTDLMSRLESQLTTGMESVLGQRADIADMVNRVDRPTPVNVDLSALQTDSSLQIDYLDMLSDNSSITNARLDTIIGLMQQRMDRNDDDFRNGLDERLGGVIQLLTEIRDANVTQTSSVLSESDQQLAKEFLERFGAAATGQTSKWYHSLTDGLMSAGRTVGGLVGGYYKGLGRLGSGALEQGGKALDWVRGALNKERVPDIYGKFNKIPLLRSKLIAAGQYLDVETNKTITSLADITGPVLDKATNEIIISKEEFEEGLFDANGGDIISRLGTGAQRLAMGAADAVAGYYGFLGNMANRGFTSIRDKVLNFDRKLRADRDVYISTRMGDGPILRVGILRTGGYFDEEGNPIYSVDDVKGPIYDRDRNLLIDHYEIDDLVDIDGNKIVTAGIIGSGMGLAGIGVKKVLDIGATGLKALRGYYGGIMDAGSSVLDKLKGGFNLGSFGQIQNMQVQAANVYLTGGQTAFAGAGDIGVGGQISLRDSLTTVATEVVDKAEVAIKDTVEAVRGVDTDQLKAKATDKVNALDTRFGVSNAMESGRDKLLAVKDSVTDRMESNRVKDDAVLGDDKVVQVGTDGQAVIKTRNGDIDIGDGSTPSIMASMVARLESMMPNGAGFDTDGDGLRDGGWRSKLLGRKEEEQTDGDSKAKEEKEGFSILDKLGGLTGGLASLLGFGGDGSGGGGDGYGLDDAITEGATQAGMDKLMDRGGRGPKPPKPPKMPGGAPKGKFGWLKRGWDAAKGGLQSIKTSGLSSTLSKAGASLGAKTAGKSLLKKGALIGGRVLLGALGVAAGPIVGPALAIAGAAWTAYEVFNFVGDRLKAEDLERYRFLQYGINPDDSGHRAFIRILEDECIDMIKYNGMDGTDAQLVVDDEDFYLDMMEEAGVDIDSPDGPQNANAFLQWFKQRFTEVFLLHHAVARQIDPDVDLLDIDDEMEDESKELFINKAYFSTIKIPSENNPYNTIYGPFPGQAPIVGVEAINSFKEMLLKKYGSSADKKEEDTPKDYHSRVAASASAAQSGYSYMTKKREQGISDQHAKVLRDAERAKKEAARVENAKLQTGGAMGMLAPGLSAMGDGKPKTANGKHIVPAEGRISSPFGMRTHPVNGGRKMHTGIDIAAPYGTPVYASADGYITRRDTSRSYGKVIYLEHEDGTQSRYAHMQRFTSGLKTGDEVQQGQMIGYVGSTGWSTGPHLHYELRKDGNDKTSAIDPVKAFRGEDGQAIKRDIQETVQAVKAEEDVGKPEDTLEGYNTITSTALGKPTQDANVDLGGQEVTQPTTPTGQRTPEALDPTVRTSLAQARIAVKQEQTTAQVSKLAEETNSILKAQLLIQDRMEKHLKKMADNVTTDKPTESAPATPPAPTKSTGAQLASLMRKPDDRQVAVTMKRFNSGQA